jgi:ATP-dependent DNA ligase
MSRVVKRSAREAIKTSRRARQIASPLPRWIPPLLCEPVETAPSGPQCLHEIKLDGFRMSAGIEHGRVQLRTRTGLDWSDKYPSIVAVLANVRAKNAYVDGELCGVGDDGLPSFSQTQAASDGERGVRLVYYAFDLLHLDGRDTSSRPLIERKGRAYPQARRPARTRRRRFQNDRCAFCAGKPRALAQSQMPQSPGVCGRRLD